MKREGLKQQLIQELKHFSAVLLTAVLILSLCACGSSKGGSGRDQAAEQTTGAAAESGKSEDFDPLLYLGHELEKSSDHLLKTGEDVDDIYSELIWTSVADTFPSRFDLRERGTVTPVKSQNPWGTCRSSVSILRANTLMNRPSRERDCISWRRMIMNRSMQAAIIFFQPPACQPVSGS